MFNVFAFWKRSRNYRRNVRTKCPERRSGLRRSQTVQRTFHPAAALAHHMGVNHRGGDIFMAEQFLDRPNIGLVPWRI